MTIDFILCQRVTTLKKPFVESVKDRCSKCGAEVWVSWVTIAERINAPIICEICMFNEITEKSDLFAH